MGNQNTTVLNSVTEMLQEAVYWVHRTCPLQQVTQDCINISSRLITLDYNLLLISYF